MNTKLLKTMWAIGQFEKINFALQFEPLFHSLEKQIL